MSYPIKGIEDSVKVLIAAIQISNRKIMKGLKTIYIEDDWELIAIKSDGIISIFICHQPCDRIGLEACSLCSKPVPEEILNKRHTMEQIINFPV